MRQSAIPKREMLPRRRDATVMNATANHNNLVSSNRVRDFPKKKKEKKKRKEINLSRSFVFLNVQRYRLFSLIRLLPFFFPP